MIPLFLHGGNEDSAYNKQTFGEFVTAAKARGSGRIALVVLADVAGDLPVYHDIFGEAGAGDEDLVELVVSPDQPLTGEMLAAHELAGLFVGGGTTPDYQRALCADRSWLAQLAARGMIYGGTSAGAAVAAEQAIVGGWQARRGDTVRQILYQGAGEGLDLLEVRPGLGLAPFSVEVHASQWGTLSRLLHAVDSGLTTGGWAIDENTLLRVEDDNIEVYGPGHAYRVTKARTLQVEIFTAGRGTSDE